MLTHKHIIKCRSGTRIDGVLDPRNIQTVLVVETDLATSPDDPDYDEEAFRDLCQAIADFLAKHDQYDNADVYRTEGGQDA